MLRSSVIVTGAGGMLGTDIVQQLNGKYPILGIGRSAALHLPCDFLKCDLSDRGSCDQSLANMNASTVIHCAAMTQVDDCESNPAAAYKDNVVATQNVVQLANSLDALLVFVSTDYVFSGRSGEPYSEDDVADPISVYGMTKYNAEEYVKNNCHSFIIFRVSWLYGLYGKCFPFTILQAASKSERLCVVEDQLGQPTATLDFARFLADLIVSNQLSSMRGNVFHWGNEGYVSWADFARFLLKQAGYFHVNVEGITSDKLTRLAKRPLNSRFNLKKLITFTGKSPRHWTVAASEYLGSLKSSHKGLFYGDN